MLPSLARLTLLSVESRVNDDRVLRDLLDYGACHDAPFSTSSLLERGDLWYNQGAVLKAIHDKGSSQLKFLPNTPRGLRNNFNFMLKAIFLNANSAIYASDRLKKNKVFMLRAIDYNGSAFSAAHNNLLNNNGFVVEAFRKMKILDDEEQLPTNWRANRSIMLRAISNPMYTFMVHFAIFPSGIGDLGPGTDGLPFFYSDPLEGEEGEEGNAIYTLERFFVEAMIRNANITYRLRDSLRIEPNDKPDLITMALMLNSNVYYRLEPYEQSRFDYFTATVKNDPMMIKEIGRVTDPSKEALKIFKDDTILAAVRQEGVALENAPYEYRSNPKVVLEAVRQNGLALQHASELMRGTGDVVLAAVRQNGHSLVFASEYMQMKMEVILAAARTSAFQMIRMLTEIKADLENDLRAANPQSPDDQNSLSRLSDVLRAFGNSVWNLAFSNLDQNWWNPDQKSLKFHCIEQCNEFVQDGMDFVHDGIDLVFQTESRLLVYRNYALLLEELIDHWRTQWTLAGDDDVVIAEEEESIEALYDQINMILYQPRLVDRDKKLIARASPLWRSAELGEFEDDMNPEGGRTEKQRKREERAKAQKSNSKRFKPASTRAAALMIAVHALPRWTVL